ncbi:MAG TPA: DUF5009 domain-containing protein, partial [Candidatus Krumholzibacteria bacterium]|nr:DUF5009 domain-containing protein [Candidatus Krumholzibacteria bacterium]
MSRRLPSLDVFRGATVAAMLLVNNPGHWGEATQFAQLRHADWNGLTFTDLIFPFFLFAVGISLVLSFERRLREGADRRSLLRHVLSRSAILVGLGLVQNRFGILLAGGLLSPHALLDARIPSVLFRIGLVFFLASLVQLYLPRWRSLLALSFVLLLGYGLLLTRVSIPGFGMPDLALPLRASDGSYHAVFSNLCAYVDTKVFGIRCLLHVSDPETGALLWAFDPEGLVSTLGAVVTALLGVATGRALLASMRGEREATGPAPAWFLPRWILFALFLVALGILSRHWIDWNKRLWTPSYVLATAGAALLFFTLLRAWLDGRGPTKLVQPLVWYGRNAITAFFFSSLLATASVYLHVPFGPHSGQLIKRFLYEQLFASWSGPLWGSLLYALGV